uniref:Uncharacterized protein n=1 Tax=Musa acuminata subsp. malaccensis TaxID=214687 RepID=A0A804HXZ8_MUSAM
MTVIKIAQSQGSISFFSTISTIQNIDHAQHI